MRKTFFCSNRVIEISFRRKLDRNAIDGFSIQKITSFGFYGFQSYYSHSTRDTSQSVVFIFFTCLITEINPIPYKDSTQEFNSRHKYKKGIFSTILLTLSSMRRLMLIRLIVSTFLQLGRYVGRYICR